MSELLIVENCKGCGKEYNVKQIKLVTMKLNDDIEVTGYNCPHCGYRYDVCITNQKIRDLQNKIKSKATRISNKRKRNKNADVSKDAMELNKLVTEHKKLMDELNGKVREQ